MGNFCTAAAQVFHDDVIKWKHFPRNWQFVRGIHRSPVNSPHKGQWRGALMFSLICVWINDWVNNREAGDLRRCRVHYDVIVMINVSGTWHQNRGVSISVHRVSGWACRLNILIVWVRGHIWFVIVISWGNILILFEFFIMMFNSDLAPNIRLQNI